MMWKRTTLDAVSFYQSGWLTGHLVKRSNKTKHPCMHVIQMQCNLDHTKLIFIRLESDQLTWKKRIRKLKTYFASGKLASSQQLSIHKLPNQQFCLEQIKKFLQFLDNLELMRKMVSHKCTECHMKISCLGWVSS